jgi:hypothetical protein
VHGSPVLSTHPKNVSLPETAVLETVNDWLGVAFAPENRDQAVAELLASQGDSAVDGAVWDTAKKRLQVAEAKLRRLRAAIEAGVDPVALVESINAAQDVRAAVQAEQANAPVRSGMDVAEVYAMIDSLGDVTGVLHRAELDELENLYAALLANQTLRGVRYLCAEALEHVRRRIGQHLSQALVGSFCATMTSAAGQGRLADRCMCSSLSFPTSSHAGETWANADSGMR